MVIHFGGTFVGSAVFCGRFRRILGLLIYVMYKNTVR